MQNKKSSKPLVSICCITYNHVSFIKDAIEGFLMQKTNFPYEIIIHDDASTDGTSKIVKEYADKYPDLIVPILQKENQYSKKGVEIMRDFLYPRTKGKYIAFCEGDDYWTDPLKLQKQFDFMEKNKGYSLCYHRHQKLIDNKLTERYPLVGEDFKGEELARIPGGIATATKFFINIYQIEKDSFPTTRMGDHLLNAYLGTFGDCKFISSIKPSVWRWHEGGIYTPLSEWEKFIGRINLKTKVCNFFIKLKDYRRFNIASKILNKEIKILVEEVKTKKIKPKGDSRTIKAFMKVLYIKGYGVMLSLFKKI